MNISLGGAGGNCSLLKESKMAARGVQNGRWGLERCLLLGFFLGAPINSGLNTLCLQLDLNKVK